MRQGSASPIRSGGMPTTVTARTQKHVLRRRAKEVLTEMINTAMPMDANAIPITATASGVGGRGGMAGASEDHGPAAIWRLLIFDDWGRDIIAPLLHVGDLRELGVTLFMKLDAVRGPVPGVPVIYFCAPTQENMDRIAQDCGRQLYEWVYLNFTAQVPRQQLEYLAQQLVATRLPSIRHIRVFDRTLSYVALDNDLFTLMQPKSFLTLNKRNVQDAEIEQHLNAMVQGILHVLLSLQTVPVIAHSKTGAAEEVARRLSVRLNDALNERQLVPAPSAVFGRPLLLLVDRSSDIATALHHPFTYRGLLTDVAGMRLNKCTVPGNDAKQDVVEIDPDKDQFYQQNAGKDFSELGGSIETALHQYQDEQARVKAESAGTGDDADPNTMAWLLATAPLLAEQKRLLDIHTKLAHGFLFNQIQHHSLDSFHGVELGVLEREGLDKEEFIRLLDGRGTLEDRQRLFLICYLMCTERNEEESFVQSQLSKFGDAPFPALTYLQHLRNWSLGAHSPNSGKQNNAGEGFGWGFAQQLAKNIANTLGGNAETELPLTKLVDALLQDPPAAGSGYTAASGSSANMRTKLLDTVTAYDPRTKKPVDLVEARFSEAIVFALGGGSIAEYDDLKKWESTRPRKAVSYGCTDITTGLEMLQELAILGAETQS